MLREKIGARELLAQPNCLKSGYLTLKSAFDVEKKREQFMLRQHLACKSRKFGQEGGKCAKRSGLPVHCSNRSAKGPRCMSKQQKLHN